MTSTRDTSAVVAWLVDGARSSALADEVLTELCERLLRCDVPLWRGAVFVLTLHPDVLGRSFTWVAGRGTEVRQAAYGRQYDADFVNSPVVRIYETAAPIRRRLADPACAMDFEILDQLRAEGATDYLALPLFFTNGEVHAATFATRAPGGFSEAHITGIEAIAAPLARVTEARAMRRTAINLLDAYLGRDAGERVLSGHVRLGDTEAIRAVIWLSDMRGFTVLADTLPPEALVALLNRFFECQVPAIIKQGGEVLKFMGDGLLAIFPMAEGVDPTSVCGNALVAARQARSRIAELRTEDLAPGRSVRFGLGLHVGDALYGNIGAGGRLDFTCIGPAVNLAARLEKLTTKIGRTILCSASLAAHVPSEMIPLGAFELQGFRSAETVFGLTDESSN